MAQYDNFVSKDVTRLGRWMGSAATMYLAESASRFVPEPGQILEIGPGKGILARHFLGKGCTYVCYEPNAAMASSLKELGAQVRTRFVPPLDEPEGIYDIVFAAHVIEHMPGPESAYHLVEGIARAVRPGGVVVISAPDYNRWGTLFYDCDYTHSFPVTPNRLRQLMIDAGLAPVRIESRYGAFGGVTGWCIDRAVRLMTWPVYRIMGAGQRMLKAGILVRPVLVAIGVKP